MSKDTIHKIYDDEGNGLYLCSACYDYLPGDKFHNEKRLRHRDYHSYRCKECVSDINRNNREPAINLRKEVNEIMEKLGYDTSDLVNNPIHVQFDKKYQEWKASLPPPQRELIKPDKPERHKYTNNIKIKDMTPEQRKEYNKRAYQRFREKYHYAKKNK